MALSLLLVLTISPAVLAFDEEDPCVADNEDFIAGGGFVDGVGEFKSGTQPWPYYKSPNEGYNLYRDDVTDTGNLDEANILTFTPSEVDLPIITSYGPYPGLDEYWYMGDTSPDTWYWALEPRGYNLERSPNGEPGIRIILPDASAWFPYAGKATAQAIDFNDGTWRIQIPVGTWVTNASGTQAGNLKVDSEGNVLNGITFTPCRGGEVTVTRM